MNGIWNVKKLELLIARSSSSRTDEEEKRNWVIQIYMENRH